ncbi:MAG: nuclear transport factor 2 family protein [Planctomycetota bacterium]
MTALQDRVNGLIEYIQTGKILEAMDEFYADDVKMQENAKDPCVGLAANIEREKEFLANVKDFHAFDVLAVGIDEAKQAVLIESQMRFTSVGGDEVVLEQVSATRWKDGKITHERFYYDSAG